MTVITNTILDVPGITVGQAQNSAALTGCTVVLCEAGAIAGVDQRGSAPGTRETDVLNPIHLVQRAHAILLAGGSAFGLNAADGVLQYLRENKVGYRAGTSRIPIVPAAVLFDLGIGDANRFPDSEMGYEACLAANKNLWSSGNFGAGTGATAGKLFGIRQATKTGIGSASISVGRAVVGAIVAVNPFGDVKDYTNGSIIAGLRNRRSGLSPWVDSAAAMQSLPGRAVLRLATGSNTVIGVVATNARLTKIQATKIAQLAQNGIVRSIWPANTMLDGDTMFALSTERVTMNVTTIGVLAEQVVAMAIKDAVFASTSTHGIPSAKQWVGDWPFRGKRTPQ